jgi:hypothetical protein
VKIEIFFRLGLAIVATIALFIAIIKAPASTDQGASRGRKALGFLSLVAVIVLTVLGVYSILG